MSIDENILRSVVRPGARVAISDGVGMPYAALGPLSRIARDVGDIRLLLGAVLTSPEGLDFSAFTEVKTLMSGFALRQAVDSGQVRYIPCRLRAQTALVAEALRPDVLVTSLVPARGGFRFGTEIGWSRAAIDSGAAIAAVVRPQFPVCDAGPTIPGSAVTVIGEDTSEPLQIPTPKPSMDVRRAAAHVAKLIPADARVQIGPGPLGIALLDELQHPVRIQSGLLCDAVADLDGRGLLRGLPIASYLHGTNKIYDWADGRPVLHGIDVTHDLTALAQDPPLVTVNTAIQIDLDGQVNCESLDGSAIGTIGGHPDFSVASAISSRGRSIIAIPTTHRDRPTLVDRLCSPVSTPGHDINVVATEHGVADLRGLDRSERRRAIASLWPDSPALQSI